MFFSFAVFFCFTLNFFWSLREYRKAYTSILFSMLRYLDCFSQSFAAYKFMTFRKGEQAFLFSCSFTFFFKSFISVEVKAIKMFFDFWTHKNFIGIYGKSSVTILWLRFYLFLGNEKQFLYWFLFFLYYMNNVFEWIIVVLVNLIFFSICRLKNIYTILCT